MYLQRQQHDLNMGEKQAISNNIQWALPDIKKNKKKRFTYLQNKCCGKAKAVGGGGERGEGKRSGPSWDLAKFHKWAGYSEVTKVNKLFLNFISDFS